MEEEIELETVNDVKNILCVHLERSFIPCTLN